MTRLWIDDLRPAPEGWLWVKTSAEAIHALSIMNIEEVSFDHDLGGDDTTRKVVLWLCEEKFAHGRDYLFPPICRVHTANPVGHDWLTGMLNKYGPGVTKGSV